MKTLLLTTTILAIGISFIIGENAYGCTYCTMIPSLPSPPITVTTDHGNYSSMDKIAIKSHISNPDSNTPLVIKITNQYDLPVVLHTFLPSNNETYSLQVLPVGPLFGNSGNYTVTAQYGSSKAVTYFYLQIIPSGIVAGYSTPLKQFKSGVTAQDVKCIDSFQLLIKGDNGQPACVRISSVSRLAGQGWNLPHIIQVENSKFTINYGISGGTLEKVTYDTATNSIILLTNISDNGLLNLQLPRLLIDSKDKSGKDEIWSVLLDGSDINYNETKTDNYRLLSFTFEHGLQKVVIIPYCSSFPC